MSRNEGPASVPTAPYTATKEYISAWSKDRVLQAHPSPMAFLHSVWKAIIYNVSLLFTINKIANLSFHCRHMGGTILSEHKMVRYMLP